MVKWEDFATFEDIAELERACNLLADSAAAVKDGGDLSDFTQSGSYLRQRLARQHRASFDILEKERPGLYIRTWMAFLFADIDEQLGALSARPGSTSEVLPELLLSLHKVLIAAHDVFDPYHRAALVAEVQADGKELVAKAMEDGKQSGVADEKAKRSQQSKKAVTGRNDQLMKADFQKWCKQSLDAGKTAATVDELQGLENFKPKWSQMSSGTLKKWARECGVCFKTGRPSKK